MNTHAPPTETTTELISQMEDQPDETESTELTHAGIFNSVGNVGMLDVIDKFGQAIAASKLCGVYDSNQGRVVAIHCFAKRMSPLEFAQKYHVVSGRVTMRSDAMLAEFLNAGGRIRWVEFGDEGEKAVAEFTDFHGEKTTVSYSIEQAKKAGLVKAKSGWVSDPGSMLRARVITRGIRAITGGNAGLYTPEELEEQRPVQQQEPTGLAGANAETELNHVPAKTVGTCTVEIVQDATDSQEPAAAATNGIREDQIEQIKTHLKTLQVPPDKFKLRLAERFHINSAKLLTEQQAEELLADLQKAVDDKSQQTQLDQWAEGAPITKKTNAGSESATTPTA